VYAEVVRRIEHLAQQRNTPADETRVLTHSSAINSAHPASPDRSQDQGADGPDRVKGVGDTLNNRFVLEECLGIGGMGTVYKALDLRKLEASDRKPYIAIKVLNVQFRGQPKSLIALQREARKAQTLAHRNIVTIHDFDRDGPMVYLTMEYLSGRPLSRVLRVPGFTGMPYAQALPIVTGMSNALAYAHERGFVHCDFKPANVLLTDAGEVKVIDFGIARVFQRTDEDTEATIFDPASLGGLTPAYASPEMFEHREPDPRDDIYALACVTYELLTGHHPFERLPAAQARIAGMRPQRPQNLGRRPWRALSEALSFERASRTPTVARFLEGIGADSRATAPIPLAKAGLALGAFAVAAAGVYTYRMLESRQQANSSASTQVASVTQRAMPQPQAQQAQPQPQVQQPQPQAQQPQPQAQQPQPQARPAAQQAQPALSIASVTPVLAVVPCSALTASVDGHVLRVQGYLPERVGAAGLQRVLGAVPGLQRLSLDVQPLADDKCDTIRTLAPYWLSNRTLPQPASIRTKAQSAQLTEGDPLVVDIKTPGYDSYVNVDYYVLDGSVVHLVPSRRARDNQAPPSYAATIGSLGEWAISKPFGSELIVLLVTPAPLFEHLRPESEPRADYLAALDKQLKQMSAKYGADRVAADIVQITTRPAGR
jgi:serine/threonine protein kinase